MRKLIPVALLLTLLASPAALAQLALSNGSQSGTVSGPATPAPTTHPSASFGPPAGVTQQTTPIPPQMPTTTNEPGSPPTVAAPVAGASPGIPVLNAPAAQASPSPSP